MAIDWSKKPKGATHYREDWHCTEAGGIQYYKFDSDGWMYWSESKHKVWMKCNGSPVHGFSEIPAKCTEPWTGEGLPPVGTVCEVHEGPALWDSQSEWLGRTVTVVNSFHNRIGQSLATVENSSGECAVFITECIRPIRTPEQIAAEEIQAIRDEIGYQRPQLGICPVEAMYHLGYRKQVQP